MNQPLNQCACCQPPSCVFTIDIEKKVARAVGFASFVAHGGNTAPGGGEIGQPYASAARAGFTSRYNFSNPDPYRRLYRAIRQRCTNGYRERIFRDGICAADNPVIITVDHGCDSGLDEYDLLDPLSASDYESCLDGIEWGPSSRPVGYTFDSVQSLILNYIFAYVVKGRWRYRLTRGCHAGCLESRLIFHQFTRSRTTVLSEQVLPVQEQAIEEIVTNTLGVSDSVDAAGTLGTAYGGFDWQTNYLGKVVTLEPSGAVLPSGLPGFAANAIPLVGRYNQMFAAIYENSIDRGVEYIDSMVDPACPTEPRFGAWEEMPFPGGSFEEVEIVPEHIYGLLPFDKCPGAMVLPCGAEAPSLLRVAPMVSMGVGSGQVASTGDDSPMETAGPPLWADFHSAAKSGLLTPEWLEEFALRIPCGICRSHWLDMLKAHPPRYDDQYAWSVEVHNVVNVRLGKPVWKETS